MIRIISIIIIVFSCIIIVSSSSNNNNIYLKNDNNKMVEEIYNSGMATSSSSSSSLSSSSSSSSSIVNNSFFSNEQIEILDKIAYFSSSLGIIGAGFIIVSFFLFKAARSFATRMILFLSIADLLSGLFYLPFGRESNFLCNLQGMGLVFSLSSSYFWTMCISISLFMVFFTNQYELNHWFKYFHYISWGIPLFTTFISLIFHAYGLTGSWCFLSNPIGAFRLLYYLPLIVVFFINLSVFVAIRVKISQSSSSNHMTSFNYIVSFYLIAFSLSQLPTIINSIQNFSKPDDPQFSLFAFQLLLQPLQGFLNCIVYGWNEGFIGYYVEFFEKYICRCRKSRELKEIETDKTSLLVDYDNSDNEDNGDDELDRSNMDKLIIDDYNRV